VTKGLATEETPAPEADKAASAEGEPKPDCDKTKDADCEKTAAAEKLDPAKKVEDYKKKLAELEKSAATLEKEASLNDREAKLLDSANYGDAGVQLRNPQKYYETQVAHQKDAERLQQAIQDAHKKIDDLKEQARKEGVNLN